MPNALYRTSMYFPQTIFMGLIWLMHAWVPITIWTYGVNHEEASRWYTIAWKSFAYSRFGLFSILALFWAFSYINI